MRFTSLLSLSRRVARLEQGVNQMHRAISAKTAFPNTPETDRMPRVAHLVTVKNGGQVFTVLAYAVDPRDALDRINRLPTDLVVALKVEG